MMTMVLLEPNSPWRAKAGGGRSVPAAVSRQRCRAHSTQRPKPAPSPQANRPSSPPSMATAAPPPPHAHRADAPQQVVLKDGHAVVHVSGALALRETEVEAVGGRGQCTWGAAAKKGCAHPICLASLLAALLHAATPPTLSSCTQGNRRLPGAIPPARATWHPLLTAQSGCAPLCPAGCAAASVGAKEGGVVVSNRFEERGRRTRRQHEGGNHRAATPHAHGPYPPPPAPRGPRGTWKLPKSCSRSCTLSWTAATCDSVNALRTPTYVWRLRV